jgi:NTP pyrophosphatase (non-canonical NTP hydrolase)
MLRDIEDFHKKFGLERRKGIENNKDLVDFRIKFLEEELDEFIDAVRTVDDVKALDALVDIVYVAMGTAYLLDYPFWAAWSEVQKANMKKVKKESARSKFDVIKPERWKEPNMKMILDVFKNWSSWE